MICICVEGERDSNLLGVEGGGREGKHWKEKVLIDFL